MKFQAAFYAFLATFFLGLAAGSLPAHISSNELATEALDNPAAVTEPVVILASPCMGGAEKRGIYHRGHREH